MLIEAFPAYRKKVLKIQNKQNIDIQCIAHTDK